MELRPSAVVGDEAAFDEGVAGVGVAFGVGVDGFVVGEALDEASGNEEGVVGVGERVGSGLVAAEAGVLVAGLISAGLLRGCPACGLVTPSVGMRGSRRGWVWVTAGGGLLLIGVGVFLAREGLQAANAWAGVLSFFLGVASLVVTVWLGLRTAPSAGGSVTGSAAGRDINVVGRASSFSTGAGPAKAVPRRGRPAEEPPVGEAWIAGSVAGRDVNRVDHLDGDFTTGDGRD